MEDEYFEFIERPNYYMFGFQIPQTFHLSKRSRELWRINVCDVKFSGVTTTNSWEFMYINTTFLKNLNLLSFFNRIASVCSFFIQIKSQVLSEQPIGINIEIKIQHLYRESCSLQILFSIKQQRPKQMKDYFI